MDNLRVAVTGLGLMTGLGLDLESSWRGVVAGRSVTKRFSIFDPEGLPCTFGVELPEGANDLFAQEIKTRNRRQMTRATMIACVTARQAIRDAGYTLDGLASVRAGVVAGATGTGYAPLSTEPDEHRILCNMASASAAWISLRENVRGPSFVTSTACSSGAYALHAAMLLIASGTCDLVVAGAADSALTRLDVQGFSALMALSDESKDVASASRPFDVHRNGFVMGEGGGMLVLESLKHARNRGARVYAELSLPGLVSECYNIVSPSPSGDGMAASMQQALDNARLDASEINYVNAHGTSTPLNDATETKAIRDIFGGYAPTIPVSSTKSTTGHCLSAAAGIEAVICCKALMEGVIPPTANYKTPDPDCDLDYVPLIARPAQLNHVMSNSFAFGGHNGTCIFSRPSS